MPTRTVKVKAVFPPPKSAKVQKLDERLDPDKTLDELDVQQLKESIQKYEEECKRVIDAEQALDVAEAYVVPKRTARIEAQRKAKDTAQEVERHRENLLLAIVRQQPVLLDVLVPFHVCRDPSDDPKSIDEDDTSSCARCLLLLGLHRGYLCTHFKFSAVKGAHDE